MRDACICCFILGTVLSADDGPVDPGNAAEGFWSFRALPSMGELSAPDQSAETVGRQPIDRYVLRKLREHDLTPNQRALPHRQLRRLSLMLTGLPPAPDVAARFTQHESEAHYSKLVDHYLDSPQFGERWARHWMDVVRFAETWGYEWNHLIREAWRYRDYLIRAFNQDLPFDQLIREHIAGDLLEHPRVNMALGINESLIGTAFYRFGETGHDDCVLYPEISLDVMDNQIDTLSKAFQALTVSCARCHDHKLDDIPQRDYYRLLGVMASSRQVIRTLDLPDRQGELLKKLQTLKHEIRRELGHIWWNEAGGIDARIMAQLTRVGDDELPMEHPLFVWKRMSQLADDESWEDAWRSTCQALKSEHDRRVTYNRAHFQTFGDFTDGPGQYSGWSTEGLATDDDVGFTKVGDFAVQPEGEQVIDGLLPAGFFSHSLSQRLNAVVRSPLLPKDRKFVSYRAMGNKQSVCRTIIANCTLPYFHTERFRSNHLVWKTVDLRHLRKSPLVPLRSCLEWATALDDQGFPVLNMPQVEYQKMLDDPRSYFGITEVFAHDVDHPPLEELSAQLMMFEVSPANLVELADHYREVLSRSIGDWTEGDVDERGLFWINAFLRSDWLSRARHKSDRLHKLVDTYRRLEPQIETPKRIVGMTEQGSNIDAPLLEGGDIAYPQEIVKRGYLSVIEQLLPRIPRETGSGRRRMAELIAHPQNPLTARVMANRIWHHLMGVGIVASVDNFGELGERPTHPELLDYLARRLIDSGWSLKTVIREIALSDTFRQSSTISPATLQKDPENKLIHRYPSRRLEAEVIRDAMLSASGRLDLRMFGPSVDPYRAEEVDRRKLYAGPLDGHGRRSLYLKVTRMGPSKLLELFNFPDPSTTRGRRDRTNVPAQALGLMNHPFVHQQAEVHAQRLLSQADAGVRFESLLKKLFLCLFSRSPSDLELREYRGFLRELGAAHGISAWDDVVSSEAVWKDLIHTLYNLKEFTYVL